MGPFQERLLRRDDMRWFRLGLGKTQVQHDPDRQRALSQAVETVREFADEAHADLIAQVTELRRRTGQDLVVHRVNYRPLWRAAGGRLRWNLFTLPGGLLPYSQVTAAVAVIGSQARQVVQMTAPEPLLAHLFEILDLTIAGWEYGMVRVDPDAVTLANRLIYAAQQLRGALANPPPLPPPVRELMRRNNSIDVCDPVDHRVVDTFNPGKQMRESLLI